MPIARPRRLAALPGLLAALLAAPALAATPTAAQMACLRMLQITDPGSRFEAVCADVLAHPATPADPLVEHALRALVEDRLQGLPADALPQVLALPRETVSAHADNPVFLLYAARALQSHHTRGKTTAEATAFADMLATLALKEPTLRKPGMVQHLQGIVTVAITQHMRQNDVEGVADWLQRLEETCADAANCYAVYAGALSAGGLRNRNGNHRALANLLADRHGVGDWRTGIAAMALAASLPPAAAGAADSREAIYRPFLAEWIKADIISRQPSTFDWFMTIARLRYERGDYRGSLEITDYLWTRARAGHLLSTDVRPLADLAIGSRICLGRYEEAEAFGTGFAQLWEEKYAPRLRAAP